MCFATPLHSVLPLGTFQVKSRQFVSQPARPFYQTPNGHIHLLTVHLPHRP
jgi:hypothetical protein